MSSSKRITTTMPPSLVDDLDFIAGRMNMTRSALIAELLSQTVPPLRAIASCIPEGLDNASEGDLRRLRGASAELISDQIGRLLSGAQGDLLDG